MDFKIIHIDETDSTNHWLKSSEGTVCVVAEYQTAGKGCGANSWESERGKNLTFSVLIHPTEIHASRQFLISEIVSVALYETLETYLKPLVPQESLSIKWPNDIYYGDKKLCGILIENRLQGSTFKVLLLATIILNAITRSLKVRWHHLFTAQMSWVA